MIDFTDAGNPVVHWQITGATYPKRHDIRIPLVDYLALVKASYSLEDLRRMIFEWNAHRHEDRFNAAGA